MNYETAKKLKDAGFRQGAGPFIDADGDEWNVRPGAEHAYVPALEELIEECGEGFGGLIKDSPTTFVAYGTCYNCGTYECGSYEIGAGPFPQCHAATPEEAVANLWLALKADALLTNAE